MELQTTFYFIGIIFMVLAIGLILMIAIIFFMVYQKIAKLHELVEKKIIHLIAPAEIAVGVGSAVAKTALKKVKDMMDSDKED